MRAKRTYTSSDMVRLAGAHCAGCGACCRGMGDTIVLDPYDVCMLTNGLGKSFGELMGESVDLHVENGVILPHMKEVPTENGNQPACAFLAPDGRCSIHAVRPGICRLFPLGRQYEDDRAVYFLLEDACADHSRAKVRIDKWLGIPELQRYEAFKVEWHRLLRTLEARLKSESDAEIAGKVNVFFLQTFFVRPYEAGASFYPQFEERSRAFEAVL